VSGSDPSKEDIELREAFQEINAGTDRTCAVVGAALIEEELEKAIRKRLGELEQLYRDDEDVKNTDYMAEVSKALKVNSFIGSLDPKIKVAYFLGIVGKEGKENLSTIASIRNKFAHLHPVRHFDDERLRQIFKGLTLHRKRYRLPLSGFPGQFVPPLPDNASRKERFMRVVVILLTAMRARIFEDTAIMHDPPST